MATGTFWRMRTTSALVLACLVLGSLTAAEPAPPPRGDVAIDFRLGLGIGPSFEFEHARDVRGTTEMAIELQGTAIGLTRAGGPLWGLEVTSAEASRSSGADERIDAGTIGIELGWAFALPPERDLRLEAAAFGGSGTLTLERRGDDLDDVYRQIGLRLGAYFSHAEWTIGLEGRYEYGVSDLDDIDGAGTDARMRHRGGAALGVVGFRF